MLLIRLPGVYRPQGDTSLLRETAARAAVLAGARVLDVGTGTGVLALAAALSGAAHVTAVDISARAVFAARANATLRRLPLRVLRGDLFAPVAGETFEVILANPPYVTTGPPRPGRWIRGARSWDGGQGGRMVLDRICSQAAKHLAPDGTLLLVHSEFSGPDASLDALRDAGLRASVVARRSEPFGRVMLSKAAQLEALGLLQRGQRDEELVVIRADRQA